MHNGQWIVMSTFSPAGVNNWTGRWSCIGGWLDGGPVSDIPHPVPGPVYGPVPSFPVPGCITIGRPSPQPCLPPATTFSPCPACSTPKNWYFTPTPPHCSTTPLCSTTHTSFSPEEPSTLKPGPQCARVYPQGHSHI